MISSEFVRSSYLVYGKTRNLNHTNKGQKAVTAVNTAKCFPFIIFYNTILQSLNCNAALCAISFFLHSIDLNEFLFKFQCKYDFFQPALRHIDVVQANEFCFHKVFWRTRFCLLSL